MLGLFATVHALFKIGLQRSKGRRRIGLVDRARAVKAGIDFLARDVAAAIGSDSIGRILRSTGRQRQNAQQQESRGWPEKDALHRDAPGTIFFPAPRPRKRALP
jgi:hypothetical protein